MKAVIVYYSLEGNTQFVGDSIAKEIPAKIISLEPVKEYPKGKVSKFFWGGKSVVFGETPPLVPYEFDRKEYDIVIIGTPVWAGCFAPPIKTFLKENDLSGKKIALFACSSGGDAEKCFAKFKKELAGSNIIATLSLVDPKARPKSDNTLKIKDFCNQLQAISYD